MSDDPADLGLKLSQLPHDHELVVAARLALEIRAARMHSYDDYADGRYHRTHELPGEHTAVQTLRYPPNGDRDEWVRPREGDFQGLPRIPEQRQAEWQPATEDAGTAQARV